MTKRSLIATGILSFVVVIAAALVIFYQRAHNEVTVVNKSGVALKSLEVALPWETIRFEPLADGQSQTRSFAIKHDAEFKVAGQLADGTTVSASDGYVTNGQYGEVVRIEVQRGGSVKFRQGKGAT